MDDVWYIENTWSCPSCGHKNQGRHMNCQNCGARREAGVEDEMPGDVEAAPRVTDPEMLKQAQAGEHWECEFCGGQERDLFGECKNCGGDREEPEHNKPYKFDSSTPPVEPYRESDLRVIPTKRAENVLKKTSLIGVSIAGVLVALTWLLFWLLLPREVNATVNRVHWETSTVLRQRVTRSGEGWGYPGGAFDTSCHRRQRGTERCRPYKCNPREETYNCRPHKCNCSTTCTTQKNGYSKCRKSCSTCYDRCSRTVYETCYHQCPVYGNWCTYKYYEWPVIQRKRAQGEDHKVFWPKLESSGPLQRVEHTQAYAVFFRKKANTWGHKPRSLAEFKTFTPGDPWLIKVNRAGQVWPLKRLTAEVP